MGGFGASRGWSVFELKVPVSKKHALASWGGSTSLNPPRSDEFRGGGGVLDFKGISCSGLLLTFVFLEGLRVECSGFSA